MPRSEPAAEFMSRFKKPAQPAKTEPKEDAEVASNDKRPDGFYSRISTRQPLIADRRLYTPAKTALPPRIESLKLANRIIVTGLLTNYEGKCDGCKEHAKECYFSDLASSWKCAGCIQRATPCKHKGIVMAETPRRYHAPEKVSLKRAAITGAAKNQKKVRFAEGKATTEKEGFELVLKDSIKKDKQNGMFPPIPKPKHAVPSTNPAASKQSTLIDLVGGTRGTTREAVPTTAHKVLPGQVPTDQKVTLPANQRAAIQENNKTVALQESQFLLLEARVDELVRQQAGLHETIDVLLELYQETRGQVVELQGRFDAKHD